MIKRLVQQVLRRMLAVLMIAGIVLSGTSAMSTAHEASGRAVVAVVHVVASDGSMVMGKMQGVAHKQLPAKSSQHDLLAGCSAAGCALCGVTQATEAQPIAAPVIGHAANAELLISITAPPPTRPPSAQV